MSLPQLHPGFPGKSFWLEDISGAAEMTATRLAAPGKSLHMEGSTYPATDTLSSVSKGIFLLGSVAPPLTPATTTSTPATGLPARILLELQQQALPRPSQVFADNLH